MKKGLCMLLVFVMLSMVVLSVNAAEVDKADSGVTLHTQAEAIAWAKDKADNHRTVGDGWCSALASGYIYYLTGSYLQVNGKDYATNYPSGWTPTKYYSGYVPQAGDLVVYDYSEWAWVDGVQCGHVGIVYSANSSSFTSIEQNIGGRYTQFCYNRTYNNSNLHVWGFVRPNYKNAVKYTIAYISNGGSGTMSGQTVSSDEWFTIKPNAFSRSGYTFSGYYVRRESDKKWYTTDGAKWQPLNNIFNNGYSYYRYVNNASFKLDSEWTNGASDGDTFTFYAQWLSNTPSLEFHDNYSGFNYLMGSDLGTGYDNYIFSRNSSIYNVDVDSSQKLNGQNSLKITGTQAGTNGNDLEFRTSTNTGYAEGSAADNKDMVFSFWGKSSVSGAKMYARWGYSSNYQSVSLTTDWKLYNIPLPKGKYYSISVHPYFDTAGTFYINSPVVTDGTWTSRFEPETETGIEIRYYTLNGKYTDLPTRTREGYIFDGWYTDAVGGTKINEGSDVYSGDKCVYAHWTKTISTNPVKSIVSDSGNRYEFYDNAMSWEEAEAFCESKGGHLATINSTAENDLVLSLISDNTRYLWIGAKYDEAKRAWSWITGEEFSYNNWADGEPTSKNGSFSVGEPYAMMYPLNYSYNTTKGSWNDCAGIDDVVSYYCWQNSSFICEYDCEEKKVLGDADGDGEVTSIDVTMIQRACANMNTGIEAAVLLNADVDGSGALEITDATYIQRHLAKMETPYAIGEKK